jgi:hypothetical protein
MMETRYYSPGIEFKQRKEGRNLTLKRNAEKNPIQEPRQDWASLLYIILWPPCSFKNATIINPWGKETEQKNKRRTRQGRHRTDAAWGLSVKETRACFGRESVHGPGNRWWKV